jgi:dipeptidyl-peptidase-4
LLIDDNPVTPVDLQVRSVIHIGTDSVVLSANPLDDPTVVQIYRWSDNEGVRAVTEAPGVHTAAAAGQTIVVRSATAEHPRSVTAVVGGPTLTNDAETPLVTPNVTWLRLGPRRIATAVLLPTERRPGDGGPALPVLLDPYGGPHAQRVVRSYQAMCASQWFADQGFAVVVADGAGAPGRGSDWERQVAGDLAAPVLDDQVGALTGAVEAIGVLDPTRVAIRGWSFGGYLAALAVLRRPEVFHAAIAGAPVTDWRLYDTHYTERYLGHPEADAGPYERTTLIDAAPALTRPLLLIHGLADDNVVAAHTLQLSSALLAAGRPHEVLPLSGVSHMTPQEVVAENLLLLQLDFLRRHLGPVG